MGYSHYYKVKRMDADLDASYKKAIKDCHRIIQWWSKRFGGLSGYSAHTSLRRYGGIQVNGSARTGQCEDFILYASLKEMSKAGSMFVKTNNLPYDIVVTACLKVLRDRLRDHVAVASDGRHEDWVDGVELAKLVLKRKRMRSPINE